MRIDTKTKVIVAFHQGHDKIIFSRHVTHDRSDIATDPYPQMYYA